MMVLGFGPLLPGTTFGMNSSGYAERVFSVLASESTSRSRVCSSYDHVLEHRREPVRRGPDFGLGRLREANHLGVASAFEVEDAVGRPAVLVVADERPVRIGGERRLTGTGEPEEDRRIAVFADVGRAMHRQRIAQRKKVVHDREHGLLDFAGITRSADENHAPFEVDQAERRRAQAVAFGVALEERRVDDGELRNEAGVGRLRRDEQMVREQTVPCELGVHAHGNAIAFVGADVAVALIDVAFGQISLHAIEQCVEARRLDRLIGVAPVDMILARGLLNEELVLRRAPRVRTRVDDQLAVAAEDSFAAPHRVFDELRRAEVFPERGGLQFLRNGKNG